MPAARKLSPRELARLNEFEAELLRAPCRLHSALAVCDQCVGPKHVDSFGFPKIAVANGRGRYKLCPTCRKLFSIADWNGRAAAGAPVERTCQGCKGDAPGH